MKHNWKPVAKTVKEFGAPDRRYCVNCGMIQTAIVTYVWSKVNTRKWSPRAGRCKGTINALDKKA